MVPKRGNGAADSVRPPVDFVKVGYYPRARCRATLGLRCWLDMSTSGPRVFFRLRELRAGDPVVITSSDGKEVTFQVNAVEQYPKGAFPSNAVYGPAPGSSLRLTTGRVLR